LSIWLSSSPSSQHNSAAAGSHHVELQDRWLKFDDEYLKPIFGGRSPSPIRSPSHNISHKLSTAQSTATNNTGEPTNSGDTPGTMTRSSNGGVK
jgi:hypothetical protein